MNRETIALIGGLILPILVAALTKIDAKPAVKAVVNGLLAAVAGWIATVIPGQPITWQQAVTTIGIAWVASTASYFGLWKPTGVEGAVAQATSTFGVGSPPAP